jgi:hypothetical protein
MTLGQIDVRCTRPAGLGRAEGVGQYFAELIRSSDCRAELGHRLQDRDRIHRLMDLLQCFGGGNSAAKCHHRVALGIGSGQARRQIGNTGTRRCDGNTRPARHAADAACNEGRVLLVPADHRLDLRVNKRIEDRVDLSAWHAEDMRHALHFQRTDDQFGTHLPRFIQNLMHCSVS